MARIGAVNDAVSDSTLGEGYRLYVTPIDGAVNPGGTLDSIEIHMQNGSAGTFDDCTIGLYYGGAAALNDPDGAIQIAEENFTDLSTTGSPNLTQSAQWLTFSFSGETIPADEDLYVVCLPNYYITQHFVDPAGSSEGDCTEGYLRFDTPAYNVSTALPTTLDDRASASATSTYPVKVAVNYTEGGGGIIPQAMHIRQQQ